MLIEDDLFSQQAAMIWNAQTGAMGRALQNPNAVCCIAFVGLGEISHLSTAFIVAACDCNQFTPSIQMLVALQVGARMAAFISGTLSQVSSYRPGNSISELGI